MNRIHSKSKKPHTVALLFLFGAVTIVIGCARVQRTSFSNLWPGEGLSKAAGKVADFVTPGKKDEKTAEATDEKSAKKKEADAKDPENEGTRIVGLIRPDRSKSKSIADTSVLASDPFLTPSQRVGSPDEKEPAEKSVLAGNLRPSARGTNPFVAPEHRQVAHNERRPQVERPKSEVIETSSEKENPFAAVEEEKAGTTTLAVPAEEHQPEKSAPAFADTFNSQMDRLREEMHETNREGVASTAPDRDFDANFPGVPESAGTAVVSDTATGTDTPAVRKPAAAPPMPETRELPEFTKFASKSRKPAPVKEVVKEVVQETVEPEAPQLSEVAARPAMAAPQLPVEEPAVEEPAVAETFTFPAAGNEPMPYITPRRPVHRSTYPTPEAGYVSLNSTSSQATVEPPANASPKSTGKVFSTSTKPTTTRSNPTETNSEFITSTKSVPSRQKLVETQSAPELAPTAKLTERVAVAEKALPAAMPPVLNFNNGPKLETVINPPSSAPTDTSMILSTKEIRTRADIRRSRRVAGSSGLESFVTTNSTSQQDSTTPSDPVAGPNRTLVINANGAVEAPASQTTQTPAAVSQPTQTETTPTAADKVATGSNVETASFAGSSGPVILANAANPAPLATTPLEVAPFPPTTVDAVVADTTAKRPASKWPPVVLGIAIAGVLFIVAARRFRASL